MIFKLFNFILNLKFKNVTNIIEQKVLSFFINIGIELYYYSTYNYCMNKSTGLLYLQLTSYFKL